MAVTGKPRVFISYTRTDGEDFARALRDKLEAVSIPTWWDREDLRQTSSWWRKIDEALEAVEYMLIVLSPAVLDSEVCRKEWQWGRRKGRRVAGIQAGKDLEDPRLPRWLRQSHIYEALDVRNGGFAEAIEWLKLVNDLNTTPQVERVPFMAEDLPQDFVSRPAEYDELLRLVLDIERNEPVAITAALRGAGGYGKTTLARALCHDLRVQEAFDDGILWVTLGENAENLRGSIRDLIQALSGERPDFATDKAAAGALSELLEDRDVLMVIDDVWKSAHVEPFLQGGKRCARLITSRMADALPKPAKKVKVDAMRESEAVALLRTALPEGHNQQLAGLAGRLGEWPLLLKLANSVLQDRANEYSQPMEEALRYVEEALDREGFTTFDARDSEARSDAVAKTMSVSLALLDPETERRRFLELALFPEDVDITLETVTRLWQRTGSLDRFRTERLCEQLYKFSLLLNFELRASGSIRLHDAIRKYLRTQMPDTERKPLHDRLVEGWGDPFKLPDAYAWRWFGYHVSQSQYKPKLRELVCDFNWLRAKLIHTDISALLSEFHPANVPPDESIRQIEGALRLSAHVLAKDKDQLAGQLLGRLSPEISEDIDRLLEQASRYSASPWLRPLRPTLDAPGGPLIRTLQGHADSVLAVAVTPDGKRAVSGSWDRTLKIWDLDIGGELATLQGHSDLVSAVAVTPDGKRAVSGSSDRTLKIWDLDSRRQLATLRGHSDSVLAVAVTPDGKRAVSGSSDGTLKIWDLNSGHQFATLQEDDAVLAVAVTLDGKLVVSGLSDRTVKIWDLDSGRQLTNLQGHDSAVRAIAITPDGRRVVSGSADRNLKIWDLDSGRQIANLQGHDSAVRAVAITPDGKRAVSGSFDRTIKIWDLDNGRQIANLQGHSDSVLAVAVTPDGKRAVSGSWDRTIKTWDLDSERQLASQQGHELAVLTLALTPDGRRAVSGSVDRTIKIWDLDSGRRPATLQGHSDSVLAVAVTPDGKRAVSGSADHTLKIWDLDSRRLLTTLQGHTNSVPAVAVTPDGKHAISGSSDRTLKIWDLESGRELATLQGHDWAVRVVALMPDGKRAVSGSSDRTLKIWDLDSGRELATLQGPHDSVRAVALTPDGKHAMSGSSDHTIKIWDLESGRVLATLQGHGLSVNAVALTPDRKHAVCGSSDGTIRVWNLAHHEVIAAYSCDQPVRAIALSNHGIIAAGDRAGRVHAFKLEGA